MSPQPTDSTPFMEEGRSSTDYQATSDNGDATFFFVSFADADVINENNYRWILALGILNILGGICCLMLPVMAAVVAESFISWTLIVLGSLNLSGVFWGERGTRGHFFTLGSVQVILGILMLANPFGTLTVLGVLIAVKVFLDGVYNLSLCSSNRQVRGWWLILCSGILSIIFALYVFIQIPNGSAIMLIGVVLGVNLLTVGSARVYMAVKGSPQQN